MMTDPLDIAADIKRFKATAREITTLASLIDNDYSVLSSMQRAEQNGNGVFAEISIRHYGTIDVDAEVRKSVLNKMAEELRKHLLERIEKNYDKIRELGGSL